EQADTAQLRAKIRVRLQQGFGDAMSDGSCLAGKPAALTACNHIKASFSLGDGKGLLHHLVQYGASQVFVARAIIDGHRAVARRDPDARHRVFAVSGSIVANTISVSHAYSSPRF